MWIDDVELVVTEVGTSYVVCFQIFGSFPTLGSGSVVLRVCLNKKRSVEIYIEVEIERAFIGLRSGNVT